MLKPITIISLTLIVCTIARISGWDNFWIILTIVIFLGITLWGIFDIRMGYFGKTYYHGKNRNNHVSLTFDDGPTPYTLQVLELLDRYQMKATFFCIGKQMAMHPNIVRQILKKGHSIGNHSYTHAPMLPFKNVNAMGQEIQDTDDTLKNITGVHTSLYRPPFGVTNPNVIKACKQKNKYIIGWSIRSLDTVIANEKHILQRIIRRLKPGDIVLLHDTSKKTVSLLEQLSNTLKDRNLQSVPVDQLLNIKAHD